jgi:hypothetical protein
MPALKPRQLAMSSFDGLRSFVPRQMTTGTSALETLKLSSSDSTSFSRSRSM